MSSSCTGWRTLEVAHVGEELLAHVMVEERLGLPTFAPLVVHRLSAPDEVRRVGARLVGDDETPR